jgi:hypothetical protein
MTETCTAWLPGVAAPYCGAGRSSRRLLDGMHMPEWRREFLVHVLLCSSHDNRILFLCAVVTLLSSHSTLMRYHAPSYCRSFGALKRGTAGAQMLFRTIKEHLGRCHVRPAPVAHTMGGLPHKDRFGYQPIANRIPLCPGGNSGPCLAGHTRNQVFLSVWRAERPVLCQRAGPCLHARMAELVYALDLGSSPVRDGGSSPPSRICRNLPQFEEDTGN